MRSSLGQQQPLLNSSRPRLWPTGCLGVIIGLILGTAGLIGAGVWTAFEPPLPVQQFDPEAEDIRILVREAYLAHLIANSVPPLPSGIASEIQLDLRSGNRILFHGVLESNVLGLVARGEVSGTVRMHVRDGRLVVSFEDIQIFGFTLPAIANSLLNEFSTSMSQMIEEQVVAGLGQGTRILTVSTDEEDLVMTARFP